MSQSLSPGELEIGVEETAAPVEIGLPILATVGGNTATVPTTAATSSTREQQHHQPTGSSANLPTGIQDSTSDTEVSPRINDAPPSYSGPPQQPIFLPYITQDLPRYSEMGVASGGSSTGYNNQGHQHHGGSTSRREACMVPTHLEDHYLSIQIPGYIPASDQQNRPRHAVITNIHTSVPPTRRPPRFTHQTTPRPVPYRDYFALSFTLLIGCILHLNLPAVLCSLSALGCSIKARDLNASRMYEESQKYSKLALICDSLAILEYVTLLVVAFTLLVPLDIFNLL